MAATSRVRTVGRVTGVVVTTAPLVRRLAKDEELRADVADFVSSAGQLVRDLGDEGRLREDLEHIADAVQSGAEHVRRDARPARWRPRLVLLGAGVLLGLDVAGVLLYPRTRHGVTRAAGRTAHGTTERVRAVRRRVTGASRTAEEEAGAEDALEAAA